MFLPLQITSLNSYKYIEATIAAKSSIATKGKFTIDNQNALRFDTRFIKQLLAVRQMQLKRSKQKLMFSEVKAKKTKNIYGAIKKATIPRDATMTDSGRLCFSG